MRHSDTAFRIAACAVLAMCCIAHAQDMAQPEGVTFRRISSWVPEFEQRGRTTIGPEWIERYVEMFDPGDDAALLADRFYADHLAAFRGLARELAAVDAEYDARRSEIEQLMERMLANQESETEIRRARSNELGALDLEFEPRLSAIADRQLEIEAELLADLRALLPPEAGNLDWKDFVRWLDRRRYLRQGSMILTYHGAVDLPQFMAELGLQHGTEVADPEGLVASIERYTEDLDIALARHVGLQRQWHRRIVRDRERSRQVMRDTRHIVQDDGTIIAIAGDPELAEQIRQERHQREIAIAQLRAVLLAGPGRMRPHLTAQGIERFDEAYLVARIEGSAYTIERGVVAGHLRVVQTLEELDLQQSEALHALFDEHRVQAMRILERMLTASDRWPPDSRADELVREYVELMRRDLRQMRRQLTTEQLERLPALPPGW